MAEKKINILVLVLVPLLLSSSIFLFQHMTFEIEKSLLTSDEINDFVTASTSSLDLRNLKYEGESTHPFIGHLFTDILLESIDPNLNLMVFLNHMLLFSILVSLLLILSKYLSDSYVPGFFASVLLLTSFNFMYTFLFSLRFYFQLLTIFSLALLISYFTILRKKKFYHVLIFLTFIIINLLTLGTSLSLLISISAISLIYSYRYNKADTIRNIVRSIRKDKLKIGLCSFLILIISISTAIVVSNYQEDIMSGRDRSSGQIQNIIIFLASFIGLFLASRLILRPIAKNDISYKRFIDICLFNVLLFVPFVLNERLATRSLIYFYPLGFLSISIITYKLMKRDYLIKRAFIISAIIFIFFLHVATMEDIGTSLLEDRDRAITLAEAIYTGANGTYYFRSPYIVSIPTLDNFNPEELKEKIHIGDHVLKEFDERLHLLNRTGKNFILEEDTVADLSILKDNDECIEIKRKADHIFFSCR